MAKYILVAVLLLLGSSAGNAQGFDSTAMNKVDGCMQGPMAQFGRYIGDWNILERRLGQDGIWTEHTGTRWNFRCVGDGIAVQDYWLPADGNAGTNLRIYNAGTESWDIVWTATATPGMARINAKQQQSGDIVMKYVTEINPNRRITFFPPTDSGWNWQLELQLGDDDSWTKVLELIATH